MQHVVHVNLSERSYDIEIGAGTLGGGGRFIADRVPLWHAVIVTDEHVEPYAAALAASIAATGAAADLLVLPPGEATKSAEVLGELWLQFRELNADRKSVVAAVGGGVVGDLAGFAAATYARGLPFFQVPTTLLSQVDSSVGGKTGINLPNAKNMVGAFWQPRGVLIDTEVLATLPPREFAAGLAEVVKYGVILDAEFFGWLEDNVEPINARNEAALRHVIARSCRLKADVVEQDEREETGLRAVLNYGHTFCHALEAITGYGEFLHGEAVAIGMLCASRLAERLGRIDAEVTARQQALLAAFHLPTELPPIDHHELVALMRHDKKVESGQLRFVLPTRLGHVELVDDVGEQEVLVGLRLEA